MQKKFNILFFLFILFVSVYHFDFWTNANTVSRAVFVKTVIDDGALNVDKYKDQSIDFAYVNGHYYSDKAPLPALLTMPVYYFFRKIGFTNNNNHLIYAIGNFISGSLPFALIVMLTFLFMQRLDHKPENILLCSLPFISSFIFIYSGTFFAHALTSFLVLAGYIFLRGNKEYYRAGVFCGMAVLCEYPVFIIAAIWAIQVLVNTKKIKPLLLFVSGGLPFGIFLMFYNYKITGHPFEFLYSHQQNFPQGAENLGFAYVPKTEAVVQLLFGIYRGILFFAPALIALAIIFFRKKEFNKNFLQDYFALPCLVYFLTICSTSAWYGGWCYGPRYLSVIAALLLFAGSVPMKLKKPRTTLLFYCFAAIGCCFTFMAKSTAVYSLPTEEKNPVFNIIIPEFFKGNFNENNLLCILFNADKITGNSLWLPLLLGGLTFFYIWQKRILLRNK